MHMNSDIIEEIWEFGILKSSQIKMELINYPNEDWYSYSWNAYTKKCQCDYLGNGGGDCDFTFHKLRNRGIPLPW